MKRWEGKNILMMVVTLALAGFLFVGLGCSKSNNDDSKERQEILHQIDVGKQYLSTADYENADKAFSSLIAGDGPKYYKSEAYYGYVLSNMLYQINNAVNDISALLGSLGTMLNQGATQSSPELEKKIFIQDFREMAGGTDTIIKSFMRNLIDPIENWSSKLAKIEDIGHLEFTISPFPVKIGQFKIMDISGEHDMGEVHFLEASLNILLGWLHFFMSASYDINILDTTTDYFILYYLLPGIQDDDVAKVPLIINTLTLLLNRNDTFLALAKPGGVQQSRTARADFQLAWKEFADTIAEIENEKDDQSDDLIAYEKDQDGNEYAVFNIKDIDLSTSVIGAGGSEGGVPRVTISSQGKLRLNIGNGMEDRLRKISANFEAGPGAPLVTWANDVAPVISALVVMILKSGMLNSVIESALGSMGSSNQQIKDLINTLMNSNLINEDTVTGLLTGLIPDFVAFKFGDFYNNPIDYRDLLPAWTEGIAQPVQPIEIDSTVITKFPTDYFLFEYECGDPAKPITDVTGQLGPLMVDSFVCNDQYYSAVTPQTGGEVKLTDMGHFGKNGWVYCQHITSDVVNKIEIHPLDPDAPYQGFSADGFTGILPYIYFPDPSFDHLIELKLQYLDYNNYNVDECKAMDRDFAEPSADYKGNKCMNFALNKVFSTLINSLNLANSLAISAK